MKNIIRLAITTTLGIVFLIFSLSGSFDTGWRISLSFGAGIFFAPLIGELAELTAKKLYNSNEL